MMAMLEKSRMDRPDRIHLHDYVVGADIGAFRSERGQEQRLRFNIEVELARPVTGAEDLADAILSYDVITRAIDNALADQRYNLLETLAETIASDVLNHPRAARIDISIDKLDRVPGALGISITRSRGRVRMASAEDPHPVVQLQLTGTEVAQVGSLVILANAPGLPLPGSGDARRIALLALDQAAWALAGRLGLDVVDTRTEMDWAIHNARPVIWAPYRMVADATELPADPARLAFWLAERLRAERVEIVLPEGQPLPVSPPDFTLPITRLMA